LIFRKNGKETNKMNNRPLYVSALCLFLTFVYCLPAAGQKNAQVRIAFEEDSKRIDLVTDRELPDYHIARQGSFQFFTDRLDQPEDFIRYFHDGRQTVKIGNLRSMEKFSRSHSQWRLRIKTRSESPQYIPRVYTFAVSFIPLNPSTGEPERRVYLLLSDLKLIDWGE